MDYGRDLDFSRSFFEQFEKLYNNVPRNNSDRDNCENCDYGNFLTNNKNCYMTFNGSNNEDCFYSNNITFSKDIYDCSYVQNSEQCYNSVYLEKSSNIFNSYNCENCSFTFYCFNCTNCHNCFLCSNITNKEYYIRNKKYQSDEYYVLIKEILLKNNELQIEFLKMKKTSIQQAFLSKNSENFSGDIIYNSKNVKHSFEIYWSENILYSQRVLFSKNCMDLTIFGLNSEFGYELHNCWSNFYQNIFCSFCYINNQYLIYCTNCHLSQNLFACIWLRNKSYCILNKQYTKDEYEKLVPEIINYMMKTKEWWEFFPSFISPFWYNETVAQEYFPLEKEKALKENFKWSTYEAPFPKVSKIIPASKLPDNILDIPDDILNWAIECEVTKKPFKIIKQELEFYRKHNLPIPKRHPDQRHLDRMNLRNSRKLFDRKCDKCGKDIKTTYSPDRNEIVYCEECYNKEVY